MKNKEELRTLKDLEIDDINEWECSNCDYMNVGDNPYCYYCDRENYDKEELKKEIKEELKEELKTLKDIKWNSVQQYRLKEELKAEAVKWAKHFYKLQGEGDWSDIELEAIDYFITTFFNITEEDLK